MEKFTNYIERHFRECYTYVLDTGGCFIDENIDEVARLRGDVQQRPDYRGVHCLEAVVPKPRL